MEIINKETLENFYNSCKEGHYGLKTQQLYDNLSNISTKESYLITINEYYNDDSPYYDIKLKFTHSILTYLDICSKKDINLANEIAFSLINNEQIFKLFDKYEKCLTKSYIFKENLLNPNCSKLSLIESAISIYNSFHEFINPIYGFLLTIEGVISAKKNINYSQLTLGKKHEAIKKCNINILCPQLVNIVNVPLRNAFAHSDYEIDFKNERIKYYSNDGKSKKTSYVQIEDFMYLVSIGSYIPESFINSCLIFIIANYSDRETYNKLPEVAKSIISHNTNLEYFLL